MIKRHKTEEFDMHTVRDFLIVKSLNNKLALFESESIIGNLNIKQLLPTEKIEVENETVSTEEIPVESLEDLLDSISSRLPVSYSVKVMDNDEVKAADKLK